VELVVTLAIVAILLSIAVPTFRDVIERERLVAYTNQFLSTLYLARSEAIKRGVVVAICKSADGATCGSTGVTWSDGWIVFVNNDNDKPASVDPNETVLSVSSALPSGYTLSPNNNFTNYLTYNSLGRANNIGTFAVCAHSDETKAKAIVIIRTHPRVATDTDGDGIPNTSNGNIRSCEIP
jgi:type IV fimbrial biogenesis protein FimT